MTRWSIEERVVMLGDLWLFADELDQQYNDGGEYYPFEVTEDGLYDELLQICDGLLTGASQELLTKRFAVSCYILAARSGL